MQNVPKIVRERLRAATPAVNHPDADVLTAFAERSLPDLERAGVFEHLARCGDCRDIVALALPATELVETPVRSATSGWLTWPVLRWGFVAAGVVAIASLGILQYQRRIQPAAMASKQTPHLEVAANEPKKAIAQFVAPAPAEKRDKIQSPAAPAFTDSVDGAKAIVLEKKSIAGKSIEQDSLVKKSPSMSRAEAPSTPTQQASGGSMGATIGGPLSHGPRLANQWTQQNAIQNQSAAPAPPTVDAKQQAAAQPSANMRVPAASEAVEVESQTAQLNTEGRNLEALKIQDLPAAQQPPGEDYALAHVDKAKPAMTTQTPKSAPSAPTPVIAGAMLYSPASLPRWTITSAGGLQRSFDQGNTWQAVDVNANPGSFHGATDLGATDLEAASQTARAKVKDADQALKRERTSLTFRAVAAFGADVWAGGSAGALYHSLDGGNHWTRVVPADAGTLLTGDIISLQFPDPQHGKVSTSTAEVWTTSDDGQTWRKQ
jgi:hypothetical protein